jgi:putative peptide zinc metalloprotease protein
VRRGDPVGYLVPPRGVSIRTAVTQDVADLVTRDGADVDVRFADAPNLVSSALLVRETPAATFTLPSPALGVRGGGEIATVPDGESERAYQSLFELELAIPEATHPGRLGGRVYVRFDHGYEPLAIRWYRAGRQLLLRQFNV